NGKKYISAATAQSDSEGIWLEKTGIALDIIGQRYIIAPGIQEYSSRRRNATGFHGEMMGDEDADTRAMEAAGVPTAQLLTPEAERKNSSIFLVSWLLTYFAAPVLYVGVVQAALCDKLGASATTANLPASAFLFGSFVPIVLAWRIPLRLEQSVIIWSSTVTSVSLGLVCVALA